MKKLIVSFIALFTVIATHAQTQVNSSKESLDITKAYNQNKNKTGTFVLAKTKSGYTISMINKAGSSQIVITDTKGNVVPSANNERRVVITGPDGTRCLECHKVDRNGTPEEECYRVECNTIEKIAKGAGTN